MRKTTGVLVAAVAVAVAYTGASWFMGKQAEQTIQQAVAQANAGMAQTMLPQPSAGGATLAVAEYRRRIFSSDVVYSLQLHDEPGQEYLLSDHLQHGPFPLGAVSAGHVLPMVALSRARLLPTAATQPWFDSLGGESPVVGRTEVHFGGKATSKWEFRPLAVAQGDEVLKFSGGSLHAALSNNFTDSKVTGAFGQFDVSAGADAERVVIDELSFEYESVSSDNKARMHSTTRAAGLGLELPDQGSLALRDATMVVSSEQQGDLGAGSVRYDFGQVLADGVNLGSLSLGASGRDFSMPALADLSRVYDELSARYGPQEAWQLLPEEAALLQEKLIALLATRPAMALDPIIWKNDQGESRMSLAVEFNQPAKSEPTMPLDMLLPQAISVLDLNLRVEKAMLVRAFEQLQGGGADSQAANIAATLYDEYAARLQSAGLASLADEAASAKIHYSDGRVDANGRQMPLPEFMQRALLVFLM